jgi:hypothetical protein
VIRFPAEWVQRYGAHITTAIVPSLGARFRYFERLRPPRSFSRVVDEVLASDPEFQVQGVGEMIHLVTLEREYGAWVTIDGRRDGSRARRCIAAVFMDDFTAVLDVIAIVPTHFAEVERVAMQLAREQQFGMARRPRMYFYVPPADWQCLPTGLIANWYPLDFPKNLTNLVVPPAEYAEGDAGTAIEASFEDAGAGLEVERSTRESLTSAGGVSGELISVTGRRAGRAEPILRELAVFVVAPYVYRMRFETTSSGELGREIFRGVAGSFRPLVSADESRIGRAFAAPLDLFDHWVS